MILFGCSKWVYLAIIVTNNAVCSYHTISPYPKSKRGGIFSVALSVNSHPPDVIWHFVLRSPDFPPMLKATGDFPANSTERLCLNTAKYKSTTLVYSLQRFNLIPLLYTSRLFNPSTFATILEAVDNSW